MHRSGDDNALQYLDFTAIDILAMQLSCLLMYWITRGGIIYQDPQFRFLAYAFIVAQISLGMFSDNYSGALSRNAKGEIKTYELNEIVVKDDKDMLIESLQMQINDLRKGLENAKSTNTNDDEPTKNTKSTNVRTNKSSK